MVKLFRRRTTDGSGTAVVASIFADLLIAAVLGLLASSPCAAQLGPDGHLDIRQIDFGDAEETGDRFGSVLASGDFNGDGWADLAIGTPDEDVDAQIDAGAVYVVYGSPFGLGLGPYQIFHQNSADMMDVAEAGDRFGTALASADINNDGWDDLAIGVPGADLGASTTGLVFVLEGFDITVFADGFEDGGTAAWSATAP